MNSNSTTGALILRHWHDRIESTLALVAALKLRLTLHGRDDTARRLASKVADEPPCTLAGQIESEQDVLFSLILRSARDETDRATAYETIASLMVEHSELEASWAVTQAALRRVASDEAGERETTIVAQFLAKCAAHLERERAVLLPLAEKLFGEREWQAVVDAMAAPPSGERPSPA